MHGGGGRFCGLLEGGGGFCELLFCSVRAEKWVKVLWQDSERKHTSKVASVATILALHRPNSLRFPLLSTIRLPQSISHNDSIIRAVFKMVIFVQFALHCQ